MCHPNSDAPGLGGYAFHDQSQGGGVVSGMYHFVASGPAILKTGLGRSLFISCFSEVNDKASYFSVEGNAILIGGGLLVSEGDSNFVRLDDPCFGIAEVKFDGADRFRIELTRGEGLYGFFFNGKGYSLMYGSQVAAGWWGMQYGPTPGTAIKNAYALTTASTEIDPCPGWLVLDLGYLEGDAHDAMALGTLRFNGSFDAMKDKRLRGGLRRVGDRFRDELREYLITTEGYRGEPWHEDRTQDGPGEEADGVAPSTVEPIANGTRPVGGLPVLVASAVTGDQKTDANPANEPNWAAATPITDNHVDWDTAPATTPDMIVTYGPGGGQCTIDVGPGNQVLTDAQALNEFIKVVRVGGAAGAHTITLPAALTDQETYRRVIRNTTDGDLTIGNGGGATVTIPLSTTVVVGVDATDVFQITMEF